MTNPILTINSEEQTPVSTPPQISQNQLPTPTLRSILTPNPEQICENVALDLLREHIQSDDQEGVIQFLRTKREMPETFHRKAWDLICRHNPNWVVDFYRILKIDSELLLFCFTAFKAGSLPEEDLKKILRFSGIYRMSINYFIDLAAKNDPFSNEYIEWAIQNKIFTSFDRHSSNQTTLFHAAIKGNNVDLLKKLPPDILTSMIKNTTKDTNGDTPLDYALEYANSDLILYLIEKGADYNYRKNSSRNSLALKIFYNDPNLISSLFSYVTPNNPVYIERAATFYTSWSSELQNQLNTVAPFKSIFINKLLAHAFGLQGTITSGPLKADYEGFLYEFLLEEIFTTLEEFLEEESLERHFNPSSVQTTLLLSPEKQLENFQNNKPVIVSARSHEHQSFIVFYEKLCFKCDRRDPLRSGIQVFKIQSPDQVIVALEKFKKLDFQPEAESYFMSGVDEDLNLVHEITLRQKPQKVGNCTLASLKTAVYALFIIEGLNSGLTKETAYEQSYKTYKKFTSFLRSSLVKQYTKACSGSHFDSHLFQKILNKASNPNAMKGMFSSPQERSDFIEMIKSHINLD